MKKAINQSLMAYILNGVSILALLFLVYSLFDYGVVNGKLDQAHEERFELTYNANRFMNGSAYLTNEVRAYAATGIQEHYDNYWNEINNLKNRDIGVANLQEIGITQEEQAMIDDMSALSNELVPLEEEAMKNVQAGKREDAVDYVYGSDYSTAITKINSLKEQFRGSDNEDTADPPGNDPGLCDRGYFPADQYSYHQAPRVKARCQGAGSDEGDFPGKSIGAVYSRTGYFGDRHADSVYP